MAVYKFKSIGDLADFLLKQNPAFPKLPDKSLSELYNNLKDSYEKDNSEDFSNLVLSIKNQIEYKRLSNPNSNVIEYNDKKINAKLAMKLLQDLFNLAIHRKATDEIQDVINNKNFQKSLAGVLSKYGVGTGVEITLKRLPDGSVSVWSKKSRESKPRTAKIVINVKDTDSKKAIRALFNEPRVVKLIKDRGYKKEDIIEILNRGAKGGYTLKLTLPKVRLFKDIFYKSLNYISPEQKTEPFLSKFAKVFNIEESDIFIE